MKRALSGTLVLLALVGVALLPACGGGGSGAVAPGTGDPDPIPGPDPDPGPPPAVYPNEDAVTFVEVAAAAGLVNTYLPGVRPTSQIKMAAGGAAGDFDRDGYQDLFVLGGGTEPDRLFLNDGDGTFTESAAAWGVDVKHVGMAVAVGDYDGDGWLDLYVTSLGDVTEAPVAGRHRLYRNTGLGSFEEKAVEAGVNQSAPTADGTGAAFGDYDLDGDLDLFVCDWLQAETGNHLFRNDGDGTFTDVTADAVPERFLRGLGARFVDMNGDRYPELLVVGDFYTSAYYVNATDGTFTDGTGAAGVGLESNGMGSDVADLDNDGLLDWYISSIYVEPEDAEPSGNTLYRNLGNDVYEERALAAGAADGSWGWGVVALDVDHDGHVDLAETNGWAQGGAGPWSDVLCRLFLNGRNGQFKDIAARAGFDHDGEGRGLIRLDLENDGDQDLVVFSYGEPLEAFRNDTDVGHHWLRLTFDTSADPGLAPDGFGTHVRLTVGGGNRYGYLDGGATYLGQSELSIHFGLGDAAVVDEIRVTWADGRVTTLPGVAADQNLEIASPGP